MCYQTFCCNNHPPGFLVPVEEMEEMEEAHIASSSISISATTAAPVHIVNKNKGVNVALLCCSNRKCHVGGVVPMRGRATGKRLGLFRYKYWRYCCPAEDFVGRERTARGLRQQTRWHRAWQRRRLVSLRSRVDHARNEGAARGSVRVRDSGVRRR